MKSSLVTKVISAILLIILFTSYGYATNSTCGPCKSQLDCNYPKTKIVYNDGCCNITVCTCRGTNNRNSENSDYENTFKRMSEKYTNCTIVNGNLELVAFQTTEILDFAKNVVEVQGYLLITKNLAKYIDLSSLRLIRGIELYDSKQVDALCNVILQSKTKKQALHVASNPNLKELWMPHLTEITTGDAELKDNPNLCHMETIEWEYDIFNDKTTQLLTLRNNKNSTQCPECPEACTVDDKRNNIIKKRKLCWSNKIAPLMCQQASRIVCGPSCSGNRCNPNTKLCCKDSCAAACNAKEKVNESPKTCFACKELNKEGECVTNCPKGHYDINDKKWTESDGGHEYQYARFCLNECPANTASKDTKSCIDFCPEGSYPYDGKTCELIEDHECTDPSKGCDKICTGLFTKYGNLSSAAHIDSNAIGHFDKSCTIIDGSLLFNVFSFDDDSHCKTKRMTMEDLEVFENVREITGSLSIENWPYDSQDLCVFRNLQKIGGKQLKDDSFALTVAIGENSNLRYLCMDSLKTITAGGIAIVDNPFLCLTGQVNWNLLSKDGRFRDNQIALRPNPDLICRSAYVDCQPYLDFVRSVKWKKIFSSSSSDQMLMQTYCKNKDTGEERDCSAKDLAAKCRQGKAICPRECENGCWGENPWQCFSCKYYEDRTNATGHLTGLPVTVNGLTIPGTVNTTCVEQCDFSKGVYAVNLTNPSTHQVERVCLPCHPSCYKTCNGSGPFHCTGKQRCKDFLRDKQECVTKCPSTHYTKLSITGKNDSECLPCAAGCMNETTDSKSPICAGPSNEWSRENGCNFCIRSVESTGEIKYLGHRCYLCQKANVDCRYGCTYQSGNATEYSCFNPHAGLIAGVTVTVLLVLIAIIAAVCYYNTRQKRKTLAKIQSVINYRDTDNDTHDEDLEVPILAPAHKANLAQLRIVTESELQFGKLLGSGAFGEVCKAIWTPFSIQGEKIQIAVAVKTLKTCEDMIHDANNQVMEEAYIMASVDCTYLTRLLGICMRDQVSLITQLMPLGSLLEYIRDPHYKSQIRSRQMLTWCLQIAKGMKYLEEEKHLVHRDLAARNVLVKTPNHVKITDFGLARMLEVKEEIYYAEGGKLPIKWLALECITERTFSHLSDVWAFGVTCWEIFMFGSRPYEGVKAIDMLSLLERGDRLPQPTCATIDIYMLLIKCWMVERLCRPTFTELVAEFTKMVMNPTRYLVLKTDDLTSPAVPISPTMDETEFFRELLQEERMCDGVVDEPDQYLLCSNVRSESQSTYTDMSPRTSVSSAQPQYTNQDSIMRVRYENGTDPTTTIESAHHQHHHHQDGGVNTGALLHPVANNGGFAPHRTDRLFSRNTPSAHLANSSSSSVNTRIAGESVSTATGEGGATPSGSTAAADDVFVDHSLPRKGLPNSNTDSCRKDSDESQRYTEDPTICQRLDDKGSYIRHMSMKESIAEEDEGDYIEGESFRYDNEDYLVPEDVANHSSIAGPSRTQSSKQRGKAIVLENLPEDDYATTFSDPKAEAERMPMPMANRTCFSNEEYMTTDSGIGDDTQSLLSRNGRSHNERNHSNRSSNESEDGRTAGGGGGGSDDSNTTPIHFKPTTPLLDDTQDSTAAVVTPNTTQMWLENPEYMLLNNGDGLDATSA